MTRDSHTSQHTTTTKASPNWLVDHLLYLLKRRQELDVANPLRR